MITPKAIFNSVILFLAATAYLPVEGAQGPGCGLMGAVETLSVVETSKEEAQRRYRTYLAPGKLLSSKGARRLIRDAYVGKFKGKVLTVGGDHKAAANIVLGNLEQMFDISLLSNPIAGESQTDKEPEAFRRITEVKRRAKLLGMSEKEFYQRINEVSGFRADATARADLLALIQKAIPSLESAAKSNYASREAAREMASSMRNGDRIALTVIGGITTGIVTLVTGMNPIILPGAVLAATHGRPALRWGAAKLRTLGSWWKRQRALQVYKDPVGPNIDVLTAYLGAEGTPQRRARAPVDYEKTVRAFELKPLDFAKASEVEVGQHGDEVFTAYSAITVEIVKAVERLSEPDKWNGLEKVTSGLLESHRKNKNLRKAEAAVALRDPIESQLTDRMADLRELDALASDLHLLDSKATAAIKAGRMILENNAAALSAETEGAERVTIENRRTQEKLLILDQRIQELEKMTERDLKATYLSTESLRTALRAQNQFLKSAQIAMSSGSAAEIYVDESGIDHLKTLQDMIRQLKSRKPLDRVTPGPTTNGGK